jgi:hypothetical protein
VRHVDCRSDFRLYFPMGQRGPRSAMIPCPFLMLLGG